MSAAHKKNARIQPLIRIRQTQFDQALGALQIIQAKVQEAFEVLQHYQNMYIQGVDRLNLERQSSERRMLEALESSIDFAKRQWYQKLSILRELQEQERQQMQEVKDSQLRLKMLEKIEQRYRKELIFHENTKEQKKLDEFANQLNIRKKSE
jgi:flagellar biosynthesis chaperone FliJ